jgi:hypothetical protein
LPVSRLACVFELLIGLKAPVFKRPQKQVLTQGLKHLLGLRACREGSLRGLEKLLEVGHQLFVWV